MGCLVTAFVEVGPPAVAGKRRRPSAILHEELERDDHLHCPIKFSGYFRIHHRWKSAGNNNEGCILTGDVLPSCKSPWHSPGILDERAQERATAVHLKIHVAARSARLKEHFDAAIRVDRIAVVGVDAPHEPVADLELYVQRGGVIECTGGDARTVIGTFLTEGVDGESMRVGPERRAARALRAEMPGRFPDSVQTVWGCQRIKQTRKG